MACLQTLGKPLCSAVWVGTPNFLVRILQGAEEEKGEEGASLTTGLSSWASSGGTISI